MRTSRRPVLSSSGLSERMSRDILRRGCIICEYRQMNATNRMPKVSSVVPPRMNRRREMRAEIAAENCAVSS